MAKYTPQFDAFTWVLRLDKTNVIIIWIVFALSLTPFGLDQAGLDKGITRTVSEPIEIANIILLILGFVITAIKDFYMYPLAETKRRRDLIDNSFGSQFSIRNSEEYYTNDEINPGIFKLGVNLFQNVFFTTNVSRKMRPKYLIKSGVFLMVFISMAIYGLNNSPAALPILQFMFSAYVLGDFIKLLLFVQRNERILENMQNFFSSDGQTDSVIMKNFTEYETNLAWGMILLDDKIFKRNNKRLEKEWQDIKVKYAIKNG